MTTAATRAKLLEALGELGRAHPNWRLSQVLSNLAMAAGRLDAGGVWDLEDDEALAAARRLLGSHLEGTAARLFQESSPDDRP
jgi:hypothetical protein